MKGSEVPLIRAVRGPLTLITIGVLFALQNFTPYSFDRTWPVLLIVFGLLTLVGRGLEPAPPPPPPPGPFTAPPYNYPPAGGYRQSPFPPVTPPVTPPVAAPPAPPSPAAPYKGGFGASAPPRPAAEPGPNSGPTGEGV